MEELGSVPFLILGNKIDVQGAVGWDELCAALGIVEHLDPQLLTLKMCTVAMKEGYAEGFKWLSAQMI